MTSWDIAVPTSLTTGVAKTEINNAQPITKPTQAVNLIEVVPYITVRIILQIQSPISSVWDYIILQLVLQKKKCFMIV